MHVRGIEDATKGRGRLDAGPFAYSTVLRSGRAGHVAQPFRDMKAKRAKQPSRDIRAAEEVRLGSVRMGLGINRQREARPHPCQTQTKRSGGLVNQARKMRRLLRKTFLKKLLTVY